MFGKADVQEVFQRLQRVQSTQNQGQYPCQISWPLLNIYTVQQCDAVHPICGRCLRHFKDPRPCDWRIELSRRPRRPVPTSPFLSIHCLRSSKPNETYKRVFLITPLLPLPPRNRPQLPPIPQRRPSRNVGGRRPPTSLRKRLPPPRTPHRLRPSPAPRACTGRRHHPKSLTHILRSLHRSFPK